MTRLLLALAFALSMTMILPAAAKEQHMEENDMGQIVFSLPSGNIGCIYTPEGGTDVYDPIDGGPELSCDRIEPEYVNVLLGPSGEAEALFDPGEQGCCGGDNIFQYDNELVLDGFICHSEKTGLVCQTTDGEHGFLMSRTHIVTY